MSRSDLMMTGNVGLQPFWTFLENTSMIIALCKNAYLLADDRFRLEEVVSYPFIRTTHRTHTFSQTLLVSSQAHHMPYHRNMGDGRPREGHINQASSRVRKPRPA